MDLPRKYGSVSIEFFRIISAPMADSVSDDGSAAGGAPLNISKRACSVWLLKLPRYLGEQVLSSNQRVAVGRLGVQMGTDGRLGSVQFTLADQLLASGLPRMYTVDVHDIAPGTYAIGTQDDGLAVVGVVNRECLVRPVINEEYLAFRQARATTTAGGPGAARVINYFTEVRRGEKYGPLRELEMLARKRKAMLQAKKRERLGSEDVLNMIFNAFEQREQWTVKDLADFTGQPVAYIQEMVNDVCVLNKKDHRNAYELKPEYKLADH